jgi:hypothetical protein
VATELKEKKALQSTFLSEQTSHRDERKASDFRGLRHRLWALASLCSSKSHTAGHILL